MMEDYAGIALEYIAAAGAIGAWMRLAYLIRGTR